MLITVGFATGVGLGLGVHREDFLGGRSSLRRRLLRLGHISCVASGMTNVLFDVRQRHAYPEHELLPLAPRSWLLGGFTMPELCLAIRIQIRITPPVLFTRSAPAQRGHSNLVWPSHEDRAGSEWWCAHGR
ncbi:MAG: hypothetical protein RMJ19_07100, partial [Gemmatales bacterium]|nr:hypothetical protein [Gemmatales bacterium]MDW8175421.1 hypothetical protein [Gemmatales bacterium]